MRIGALVYPNINLRRPDLIKESLLLYENLYRIVPEGIVPKDDKEIDEFNREYELIGEISPKQYVRDTYDRFKGELENWSTVAMGLDFDPKDHSYTRLHKDKVYDRLRKEIIDEGFLDYDGTWFQGDETFIGSYMMYLAIEISSRNNLFLITDDTSAWTCQEFMNYGGDYASSYVSENTHSLLNMYIKDYVPSNIEDISFDSIIEFRDRYKQERRNFVSKYAEFQDEITSIASKDVLDDRIRDHIGELDDAVRDFKDKCSFFKTDRFFGLRAVSIPAIISVAESFVSLDPSIKGPLMVVGLAFGGLWGLVSTKRAIKDIRKSNPYSYLVCLEKHDFKTLGGLNTYLSEEVKEFVED